MMRARLWLVAGAMVTMTACADETDDALPGCGGHEPELPLLPAPAPRADGSCLEAISGPRLLANCDLGPPVSISNCELKIQARFCAGGMLTSVCRRHADCPVGAVCDQAVGTPTGTVPENWSPGFCKQLCQHDRDCVRCDLVCHPNGLCGPPLPGFPE